MAIGLTGDDLAPYDPFGGLADLDAGLIRVLHDRASSTTRLRPARRPLRHPPRLRASSRRPSAWLARPWPPTRFRPSRASGPGRPHGPPGRARGRKGDRAPAGARDRQRAPSGARPGSWSWWRRRRWEPPPSAPTVASRRCGSRRERAGGAHPWLADLDLLAEERDAASRAARVAPRIAMALREREHSPRNCATCWAGSCWRRWRLRWPWRAPSEPILRWLPTCAASGSRSPATICSRPALEGPAVGRGARGDAQQARRCGRRSRRGTGDSLQLAREHAQ